MAAGVAVVAIAAVVVVSVASLPHPSSPGTSGFQGLDPVPSATPTAPGTPRPTPTNVGDYVALGDSYAAGVGGGYEQGACQVSPYSYPSQLDGTAGIVLTKNAACNAATTSDVVSRQLDALTPTTRLVTLSVGGNDLNVGTVAEDCAGASTANCGSAFTTAISLMRTLPAALRSTYEAVAAAAPHARIVVTGYPDLFAEPKTNSLTLTSATLLNAFASELDAMIKQAVAKEHAAGRNIRYVGVDFDGHAIGSSAPWIVTRGAHAFHPTEAGYREYARAILASL